MWKIVVLAILLIIALVMLIRPRWRYTDEGGYPRAFPAWVIGVTSLFLAGLFVLLNSFTQVHAKEIGVEVAFGKPVGEYNAGIHGKPFWASVTKVNETIYTDTYDSKASKKAGNDVQVRLGDGNIAYVPTTIRWHVNPATADYIYSNYRSNDPADNLRDSVVDTQFKSVVSHVFGTFNPTRDSSTEANFLPNYTQMAADITKEMDSAVKDSSGVPMIIIDNITVSGINYTKDTEKRITGIVQQQAKTQQALLLEATNTNLANANKNLTNSLAGPDGEKVLVQQCLQDLADGKFTAPAGFSCWPNSGSSVVIPSAK